MAGFIVMHVGLVFLVHGDYNMVHMVFGDVTTARAAQAYTIVIATIVIVVLFWIVLSYWSLADRERAQRFTAGVTEIGRRMFLNRLRPRMGRQNVYTDKDISEFHWTNGLPPTADESPEWIEARDNGWEGFTITVGDDTSGEERVLTLDDLTALPRVSYVAVHTCMQGWSATSRWSGARLRDVMELVGPRPEEAEYVLVESYGLAQKMYDNRPREPFYAVLDLDTVYEDDTIVAYERNGRPLETHLGAPARLRAESNHGYKMVKWIHSIRWIHDYTEYGDGRGGTREDSALQAFNGRI
ncbi:MAG TPA: molybdopterin-dependent oxidoreductase, partial [Brevibacterium sp.]|nr:molybdopterin-dependent oxidoreductase [Brevibacterium sp.]